jgi:hypothetical protein
VSLNWKPITKKAVDVAESLGHVVRRFEGNGGAMYAASRIGVCEKCGGCCFIGWRKNLESKGGVFSAGGRILKYRCGTPEAAGFLNKNGEAK